MRHADTAVLAEALTRLREIDEMLMEVDAGICTIHLDATIAALESRINQLDGGGTSGAARPQGPRPGPWSQNGH